MKGNYRNESHVLQLTAIVDRIRASQPRLNSILAKSTGPDRADSASFFDDGDEQLVGGNPSTVRCTKYLYKYLVTAGQVELIAV